MSGYCHCTCRDCFEIAIEGDDEDESPLCHACEEAGCSGEIDEECLAPHAYCSGEDVDGVCTDCGEAF